MSWRLAPLGLRLRRGKATQGGIELEFPIGLGSPAGMIGSGIDRDLDQDGCGRRGRRE